MFNDDNFKAAGMLARDIAYHCRMTSLPCVRLDLICSTIHGETTVSAVCDRESGWLYMILAERTDGAHVRMNNLIHQVNPYRTVISGYETLPLPYRLIESWEKPIDTRQAVKGMTYEFCPDTARETEDLVYKALTRARRDRRLNKPQTYIRPGLNARINMYIQAPVNDRRAVTRKPIKQMLGKIPILLSTTYYGS